MKKRWTYLLASTAVLASAAWPLTSFADEDGASYTSNGVVQFRPNGDQTKPTDPENPDPNKPIVPIDPTNPTDPENPTPGTKGPLSIDFASSFDFGLNKISSKDEVYNARAQKAYTYNEDGSINKDKPIYRGNYVQVTDNRGTNAGWTLTVKQDGKFTAMKLNSDQTAYVADDAALNKTLEGAQITLDKAAVASNATEQGVIGRTGAVTLNDNGSAATIMSAEKNKGAGTWVNRWGESEEATEKGLDGQGNEVDVTVNVNKAVTLSVPGKSAKDANTQYRTTLTWSLTNTPGNATIQ